MYHNLKMKNKYSFDTSDRLTQRLNKKRKNMVMVDLLYSKRSGSIVINWALS